MEDVTKKQLGKGVVVLDVDGVIANSVAENFPHAINA